MKPQLALSLLLIASAMIMTATPAFAYSPGYCTNSVPYGSYTYTASVTPCSGTPGNAPFGSTMTMKATTNDPSIVRVEFTVTSPSAASTTYVTTSSPFTQTFSANEAGTWVISVIFCDSEGTCTGYDVVSFTVQVLVLNALPLGAVTALGVSLAGLVAYTRIKKRPLPS
jgi:hypothetical protein